MTRILLVADRLLRPHRTGIDLYYDKLLYWLPRLAPKMRFTVVSFGDADQQLPWFAPNLVHHGLPLSRRRFFLQAFLRQNGPLNEWLTQADLVHVMGPLPVTADRPLLTTVYDLTPLFLTDSYPWFQRMLVRWTLLYLAQENSYFSVISEQTRKDLHSLLHVPLARIYRIYLGVGDEFWVHHEEREIQRVRAKYYLPERYFLYIGSMHKRKNLPTALLAYKSFIVQDTTNTKLVLAGRMDLGGDILIKQVHDLGLDTDVVLPGYIDGTDLPVVISGAIALLYPSLYEGFGFPPLEAMACGTPVIASNAGPIPEVTGGHALLCDPLNAQAFTAAMLQIAENIELRQNLVKWSQEWARRFSWRVTAEETLRLYNLVQASHCRI